MKKNNIYLPFNPLSEVIAVPFLVSRIFKGKKIKDLIDDKIELVREKSAKINLTEKERFERHLEFKNLDNFFVNNFRALDNSAAHSFEDKINYCLNQYSKESRKILTSTNLVVLEENFLKGAEKTLFLYFLLNKDFKEESELKNGAIQNLISDNQNGDKEIKNKIFSFIKLEKISKDKELFNLIDFSKLKDFDVIYDSKIDGFEFKNQKYSDIIFLCIILDNKRIIELPSNQYINEILMEIKGNTVSETNFSNCKTKYLNPQILAPSENDKKIIKGIENFIEYHINEIKANI